MTLEECQVRIIAAYSTVRKNDEGLEFFRPSKRSADTFLKAAQACLKAGASPEEYVEQQYLNKPEHVAFFPNLLLNKYTKVEVCESKLHKITDFPMPSVLNLQKKYLSDAIHRRGLTPQEALMSDNVCLAAWFRIVITDNPVPEVIQKYKDAAKKEMFPALYAYLAHNKFDVTRLA